MEADHPLIDRGEGPDGISAVQYGSVLYGTVSLTSQQALTTSLVARKSGDEQSPLLEQFASTAA